MEYGLELWDTLWEAGRPHGLVAAGYRAIDSLRLEKGYRYWSADITPDDTPYEAGLGFAVKLGKGEFHGREALVRQRAEGVRRKLACLTLSDPAWVALGGEPVRVGDRVVGRVTSGGLRLHGGAVDRVRVPSGRGREPGDVGRRRVLRRVGRRAGGRRALWDPRGDRIEVATSHDRRERARPARCAEEVRFCPSRPGDAARGYGDPMPRIAVNGIRLHYEEAGQGLPLLFVHEFAGDAELGAPGAVLRPALPDDRLQCRGYPPSDVPRTCAAYSQDQRRGGHPRRARCTWASRGARLRPVHGRLRHAPLRPARPGARAVAGRGGGGLRQRGRGARPVQAGLAATVRRFEAERHGDGRGHVLRGPTRVQFIDKDPRGWQEFHDQFAAESAHGHALTCAASR